MSTDALPPPSQPPTTTTTSQDATATTTSPSSFPFPPLYSFPPFFTLQPNAQTLLSQLQTWSSLIQSYCAHNRLFLLNLTDALSTPLFHNRSLGRKLQPRDARKLVDWMASAEGGRRAEWVGRDMGADGGAGGGGGGGGGGGDGGALAGLQQLGLLGSVGGSGRGRDADADDVHGKASFWVYWRRPEEWAEVVEGWVDATGQRGSVLTVYELLESDATRSQEFHGMDPDLMQKSLQVLVKRGKAQVFGDADSLGVKFF